MSDPQCLFQATIVVRGTYRTPSTTPPPEFGSFPTPSRMRGKTFSPFAATADDATTTTASAMRATHLTPTS